MCGFAEITTLATHMIFENKQCIQDGMQFLTKNVSDYILNCNSYLLSSELKKNCKSFALLLSLCDTKM